MTKINLETLGLTVEQLKQLNVILAKPENLAEVKKKVRTMIDWDDTNRKAYLKTIGRMNVKNLQLISGSKSKVKSTLVAKISDTWKTKQLQQLAIIREEQADSKSVNPSFKPQTRRLVKQFIKTQTNQNMKAKMMDIGKFEKQFSNNEHMYQDSDLDVKVTDSVMGSKVGKSSLNGYLTSFEVASSKNNRHNVEKFMTESSPVVNSFLRRQLRSLKAIKANLSVEMLIRRYANGEIEEDKLIFTLHSKTLTHQSQIDAFTSESITPIVDRLADFQGKSSNWMFEGVIREVMLRCNAFG